MKRQVQVSYEYRIIAKFGKTNEYKVQSKTFKSSIQKMIRALCNGNAFGYNFDFSKIYQFIMDLNKIQFTLVRIVCTQDLNKKLNVYLGTEIIPISSIRGYEDYSTIHQIILKHPLFLQLKKSFLLKHDKKIEKAKAVLKAKEAKEYELFVKLRQKFKNNPEYNIYK